MSKAKQFRVVNSKQFTLSDYPTSFTGIYKSKNEASSDLKKNTKRLAELQYRLFASNKYAVLIILQAMDAAGKDGVIRHVMSGINPQGCIVHSFKHPEKSELARNYLWRHVIALPEKGMISIFNRSHYENVLICKVHPELVLNERIPGYEKLTSIDQKFWHQRYQQINRFEGFVHDMGTIVLKFFLNISKKEQKRRFLGRLNNLEKQWKFSFSDIRERNYWDDYMQAYQQLIRKTSTSHAPWYVIPADHKWFTRVTISQIIIETLEKLDLRLPKLGSDQQSILDLGRTKLEDED
ncbi:polyphosphate kinase 2 family protein [Xanthovirga aplysinae]|uniref:polyphosphate kinase 2 family protein n=1 Tax=Xanthovirga aplysinae TaxID=2529853 RepID=UPI0012BC4E9C|nr:polyphosphate kinase 2 family protein [Xanthovirga aplysinae]MTI31284.1 polyphosphate kinase 2 family protein [Xanthovirga aplysinae]